MNSILKTSRTAWLSLFCLIIFPACEFKCSLGGQYSHDKVIAEITKAHELTNVECPKMEDPKTGTVFRCSGVDSEGKTKSVIVEILDDSYNIHMTIYKHSKVIDTVKEGLNLKDLVCPILEDPKKGDTLSCTAVDADDQPRLVLISFTSDDYHITAQFDD